MGGPLSPPLGHQGSLDAAEVRTPSSGTHTGFHTAAFSPGPEVYLRVLTHLFLQVSGQTSRPLTLQTPMPWWQLLPLEKDCLIGDLQAAVALASQASQELEQSLQEPQDYSWCR